MLICGVQLEVVPTEKLQISQNPPNILWQMITVTDPHLLQIEFTVIILVKDVEKSKI